MIGHRIVTAAQHQLIGQTQRAVPIKRRAPLLLAGAALAGHQAAETEGLAPHFERLQIARGGGVFAVTRIRLAGAWITVALSVERADAFLHPQVEVDEGAADPPTVVDAELRFADAVAAQLEFAVFDEIVGAQAVSYTHLTLPTILLV